MVKIEKIAERCRPLAATQDFVIAYNRSTIVKIDFSSKKKEYIARLNDSLLDSLTLPRIIERLVRTEIKSGIIVNDSEFVFSRNGSIYSLDILKKKITKEYVFRKGMNNPLYFSKVEGIEGFEDVIVFGDYIGRNSSRYDVGIYSRPLRGGSWEIRYRFPNAQIRHVHGIIPDSNNKCVYILTGDEDDESGIWVTYDDFRTVKPILIGSQRFRSVYLFNLERNRYVYATDTTLEQNYIYETDFSSGLSIVSEIDGSCLSATDGGKYIYFSTTVEGDETISSGFRKWINTRRGPGIKSDYAQLVALEKKTKKVECVLKIKKDRLPPLLFQYGYFVLCRIPNSNNVLAYPVATIEHESDLLLIKHNED